MARNVFILGAGFSHSAGIPLLRGLGQTMWELAERQSYNGKPLEASQIAILQRAAQIRESLYDYHGGARFNDRDIEDVLSILLFDTLGGPESKRQTFDEYVRAIATTIEITCSVQHPGPPERERDQFQALREGPEDYRLFWQALFSWVQKGRELPVIITFNYDLVLERALLQTLISTYYDGYKTRLPTDSIRLKYGYENVQDISYRIEHAQYDDIRPKNGTVVRAVEFPVDHKALEIEIYKLHGSVNFPIAKATLRNSPFNIAKALEQPFLLPPIFNKISNGLGSEMWARARDHLRVARNVIFVGYSLPRTDVYMQYFLKAALGPNRNLNQITVFDPVLFENGNEAISMKSRFADCFADQMGNRLNFNPVHSNGTAGGKNSGTMSHFVNVIEKAPERLLFS